MLLAGHADAGTPEPIVHPVTGTIIMQTNGQAIHLGYLRLTFDPEIRTITDYDGRLIPVDPSLHEPDASIVAKLTEYRNAYPEIQDVIGKTAERMNRRYIKESDVGHVFTDAFRAIAATDIAFVHSASLRKDLPEGDVRVVDLLDTYPIVDDVIVKQMSGAQLRRGLGPVHDVRCIGCDSQRWQVDGHRDRISRPA